MQKPKFNTIDEFLDYLPEDELKITLFLRKLVRDCIPNHQEKLNYNVSYFKKHSNICFIWPASVLWGKQKTYSGVRFGFTKGYMLHDELNYLKKGDRKQVYWKDFNNIAEIDVQYLKTLLFEAVEIDESLKSKK